MTKERCKELLPIIKAYAEGKKIQIKHNGTCGHWVDCGEPMWTEGSGYCYRVAPEPRNVYLIEYPTSGTIGSIAWPNQTRAATEAAKDNGRVVTFIEQIEEQKGQL